MTVLQKTILVVLTLITLGTGILVANSESGWGHYLWFRDSLQKQQKLNEKMAQENIRLRKKVMALRYDRRVIERDVRDLLSLTRDGEIIVILSK